MFSYNKVEAYPSSNLPERPVSKRLLVIIWKKVFYFQTGTDGACLALASQLSGISEFTHRQKRIAVPAVYTISLLKS